MRYTQASFVPHSCLRERCYVLNNPLKYTDLTGNEYGGLIQASYISTLMYDRMQNNPIRTEFSSLDWYRMSYHAQINHRRSDMDKRSSGSASSASNEPPKDLFTEAEKAAGMDKHLLSPVLYTEVLVNPDVIFDQMDAIYTNTFSNNAQANSGDGGSNLGTGLSAFDFAAGVYSEYGHNHTTYTTTKGIEKNIFKANGQIRSARAAGFARASNFVRGVAVVGSIVSTTYSGYQVYDQIQTGGLQNVNGWDATDTGVGLLGLGATGAVYFGLMSNPIGWGIGAGVLLYSGSRLAYDLYNKP